MPMSKPKPEISAFHPSGINSIRENQPAALSVLFSIDVFIVLMASSV